MNKITYTNFNEKAQIYSKTRAGYSNNYINVFCEQLSRQQDSVIVDIAAGTGINTKQIAKYCKKVYAVEPNLDMMNQCKLYCGSMQNIEYIAGTSENTTLPTNSANIITIAQAFQLLDLERTKCECQRLIRKGGKVILVWNSKETKNEFFYETEKILLKYCPLYSRKIHVLNFKPDTFSNFFKNAPLFYRFRDDGAHFLTKDEFVGRALCASYSLSKNDSNYSSYVIALEDLFNRYAINNLVYAPLSTIVYVGDV